MPFGNVSAGNHDDGLHEGDAKRDVDNGVAGLNNNGNLIAPGDSLLPTLGLADKCFISDRTSGELMLEWERLSSRTWVMRTEVGGTPYDILNTSHANQAFRYAGLDAYGHISPLVHPPTEAITDISMGATHPFARSLLNGNGSYTDDTTNGYLTVSSGSASIGYSVFEYIRDLQLAGYHTVVSMEIAYHNAGVSGDHIGYFGFKDDFTAQDNLQCAMVEQVHAGTCEFITAAAGAATKSTITALDAGDTVAVLMESGNCICYVNGIVEAVHTTNLPTSTNLKAGLAAHVDAAGVSPRQYGVAGFNIARSS